MNNKFDKLLETLNLQLKKEIRTKNDLELKIKNSRKVSAKNILEKLIPDVKRKTLKKLEKLLPNFKIKYKTGFLGLNRKPDINLEQLHIKVGIYLDNNPKLYLEWYNLNVVPSEILETKISINTKIDTLRKKIDAITKLNSSSKKLKPGLKQRLKDYDFDEFDEYFEDDIYYIVNNLWLWAEILDDNEQFYEDNIYLEESMEEQPTEYTNDVVLDSYSYDSENIQNTNSELQEQNDLGAQEFS